MFSFCAGGGTGGSFNKQAKNIHASDQKQVLVYYSLVSQSTMIIVDCFRQCQNAQLPHGWWLIADSLAPYRWQGWNGDGEMRVVSIVSLVTHIHMLIVRFTQNCKMVRPFSNYGNIICHLIYIYVWIGIYASIYVRIYVSAYMCLYMHIYANIGYIYICIYRINTCVYGHISVKTHWRFWKIENEGLQLMALSEQQYNRNRNKTEQNRTANYNMTALIFLAFDI